MLFWVKVLKSFRCNLWKQRIHDPPPVLYNNLGPCTDYYRVGVQTVLFRRTRDYYRVRVQTVLYRRARDYYRVRVQTVLFRRTRVFFLSKLTLFLNEEYLRQGDFARNSCWENLFWNFLRFVQSIWMLLKNWFYDGIV
jgi:hypothetical protein